MSMSTKWKAAPKDATHYNEVNDMFYKLVDDYFYFYEADDETLILGGYKSNYADSIFVERPKQPQAWSGDGLPPAGTVCEVKGCMSHYLQWNKVTVFAVRGKTVMFDMEDGRWGQTDSHEFRTIQTPAQLRESAIRELMDIAQVDCRVTAARLVDAGFKRN